MSHLPSRLKESDREPAKYIENVLRNSAHRSHDRRGLAHRAARQPRRHARVLRLRHFRHLRPRHRRRDFSEQLAARLADGVIRGLCRRLPGPAPRRHRPQPLRRSVRSAARVPLVGVRDVGRHAGHGTRADACPVGRCCQRADGGVAAGAGLLPRWRAAGCAHLRRRDRAEDGAVRLRRRVRLRDARRGRGHRRQPLAAHAAPAPNTCPCSDGASRSSSAASAAC